MNASTQTQKIVLQLNDWVVVKMGSGYVRRKPVETEIKNTNKSPVTPTEPSGEQK